ncbi:MAG: DUF2059 domain-containing protein [Pseudomonadota bacterium]
MRKFGLFAAPVAFAFAAATPLAAQDDDVTETVSIEESEESGAEDIEAMMGLLGALFQVEPLTPEQEARLPIAQSVAEKMIPEGALGEMMGTLMKDIMDPFTSLGPPPANATVSKGLGISLFELDLTEEQTAEVAALLDPAFEVRSKREMEAFPQMLSSIMSVMEPSMREAMAELYAIRFEDSELTELNTFFATPLGEKFASESFKMAADPRLMVAGMEALPQLLGTVSDMESAIEAATADLPEKRAFADLPASEKARISELTGLSAEEIEARISEADAAVDAYETGDFSTEATAEDAEDDFGEEAAE